MGLVRRSYELFCCLNISDSWTKQQDSFCWDSLPSCDFRSLSTAKGERMQVDLPALFLWEDRTKKRKQKARVSKCFPLSFVCHLFKLIVILVIKVEITCCFLWEARDFDQPWRGVCLAWAQPAGMNQVLKDWCAAKWVLHVSHWVVSALLTVTSRCFLRSAWVFLRGEVKL